MLAGSGSWTSIPSTRRVGVEPVDQRQQLASLVLGGKAVREAFHPRLARRLALGADVDGAGRVLADQDDSEPRRAAGRGARKALDRLGDAGTQLLGRRRARRSGGPPSAQYGGISAATPPSRRLMMAMASSRTKGEKSMPPKSGMILRIGR